MATKSSFRTEVSKIFKQHGLRIFASYTDKTNPKSSESNKRRIKLCTWERLKPADEKKLIEKIKNLSNKVLEVKYHTPTGPSNFRGYAIYVDGLPGEIKIKKV